MQVKYGFSAQQYTKGHAIRKDWDVRAANTPYDSYSIMHYGTDFHANRECERANWNECAFSRWENREHTVWGYQDGYGVTPSWYDVYFLKSLYRYQPPGTHPGSGTVETLSAFCRGKTGRR